MKTATGNYPLGWRRRKYAWEQDLDGMIAWALDNELEVIDLGRDADNCAKAVVDAGLRVGSADLTAWGEMMSPDGGARKDAVAQNADYIEACVAAGARTFFICMVPEDPTRGRAENFAYMVERLQRVKIYLRRQRCLSGYRRLARSRFAGLYAGDLSRFYRSGRFAQHGRQL